MNTKNNTVKSTFILTLTAMIWGMGFVSQRSGMEFVGPFFFSGIRMLFGSGTLCIVLLFRKFVERRKKQSILSVATTPSGNHQILFGGLVCGIVLFFAGNFQQVGLVFTTASKAGFLTALYIVLVPILGIFLKHKMHWNTWISVVIAAAGLYFLSITENLSIEPGDMIVLIGAVFWAGHILVVDHFVESLSQKEVIKMCAVQFAVAGILSFICFPFLDGFFVPDGINLTDIRNAMIPILYAGIFSTGAGFTLQAVGQRDANPSAASIILSLEAVFSVIFGFLLLRESFSGREALGCILMFAAVILAQAPIKHKNGT